jgi:adenylosuccinate synthase
MKEKKVKRSLFESVGVHCIVDGQFGSTGKGALAYWLAKQAIRERHQFQGAIYSGGPNSGHTFYHEDEKHVLKQLPSFAVATTLMGGQCSAYLSAGAVINPKILFAEAEKYPNVKIYIHPNAAIVDEWAKEAESGTNAPGVASTMSGTGGALILKIARSDEAIWGSRSMSHPKNITTLKHNLHPEAELYFMEVSQGFSLGINSEFYPYVTSRECTVMQGLADARIPARHLARTYMTIRTFPIRVGGNSGGWYDDQLELDWEDLGIEPELTTVTQRQRRIATFSFHQFTDALRANDPDFVFVNFLNYLGSSEKQDEFLFRIKDQRDETDKWFEVIGGYGPKVEDIFYIG